jgi:hypothetical protein
MQADVWMVQIHLEIEAYKRSEARFKENLRDCEGIELSLIAVNQ